MRIWKWFRLLDLVQWVGRKRPGLPRPSATWALRFGAGPLPSSSAYFICRIARVCAVPKFDHDPILVAEVLAALKPAPDGRYVDGTIGGGGHANAILAASRPSGWLFGCDRDGVAIEAATERLQEYAGRFELRQGNFANLSAWLEPNSID